MLARDLHLHAICSDPADAVAKVPRPPWPSPLKSHEPLVLDRKANLVLDHGQEGAGANARVGAASEEAVRELVDGDRQVGPREWTPLVTDVRAVAAVH